MWIAGGKRWKICVIWCCDNDIVLEELPYILEDFLLDQYDIAV